MIWLQNINATGNDVENYSLQECYASTNKKITRHQKDKEILDTSWTNLPHAVYFIINKKIFALVSNLYNKRPVGNLTALLA